MIYAPYRLDAPTLIQAHPIWVLLPRDEESMLSPNTINLHLLALAAAQPVDSATLPAISREVVVLPSNEGGRPNPTALQ